jgi:hypothetical protein
MNEKISAFRPFQYCIKSVSIPGITVAEDKENAIRAANLVRLHLNNPHSVTFDDSDTSLDLCIETVIKQSAPSMIPPDIKRRLTTSNPRSRTAFRTDKAVLKPTSSTPALGLFWSRATESVISTIHASIEPNAILGSCDSAIIILLLCYTNAMKG